MDKLLFLLMIPTTLLAQWESVYSSENEIYAIDYFDSSLALLKLDSVILSLDGGESWSGYQLPDSVVLAYDLVIYNRQNILVTGALPKLMITNDQGHNWNVFNPLEGVAEYLTSICRLEGVGIAGVTNLSSFIVIDTLGAVIQFHPDVSAYPLYDIVAYGQDSIMLLGNEAIFYSIDRGLNWGNYSLGGVSDVGFDKTGWAAIATSGDVFVSEDCGEFWYPFYNYFETEISTHITMIEPFSDMYMMFDAYSFPQATYLFNKTDDSGEWLNYPNPLILLELDCDNNDHCYSLTIDSSQSYMEVYMIDTRQLVNNNELLNYCFILHPNPATTSLIIEHLAANPNAVVSTITLSGQRVAVTFENGQANISHLPPGIYLTTVQTEQGKWQEKWLKL